jgi:putative chitinase
MQPAVLQSLYGIRPAKAERWVKPLVHAMGLAECTTHFRRAAFLAQVGWESGSLTYTREIWGPTTQQKRYDPKTTLAGKLGNVHPGDGRRYMGRGLLQTTGHANYVLTTLWLRELLGPIVPDFEQEPHLLELDLWAAMSAALYWRKKNLNRWVDAGDFAELTRRINGGYTHLAERQLLYARGLMLPLDEEGLVLKAANDLTYRKVA